MRVLDYAWNMIGTVSGADHTKFRLILDKSARFPTIGLDADKKYIVRIPAPDQTDSGLLSLQGLYLECDGSGWETMWRLFKASVNHGAFHVAYANPSMYSEWAKTKPRSAALFSASLVEDYRITMMAKDRTPGVASDIAYANYISARRMPNPDKIQSAPLRLAVKMLLALWGLKAGSDPDESRTVMSATEKAKALLGDPTSEAGALGAVDQVYKALPGGVLSVIPAFAHTELHGANVSFDSALKGADNGVQLQNSLAALGLSALEESADADISETYQTFMDEEYRLKRLRDNLQKVIEETKLTSVQFPPGDYSEFLKIRADLAGPIRSIRNQVLLAKNMLDEDPGKESGQVDLQAAMQMIASKQRRSDIFQRDEQMLKEEAWAILIDASKSMFATAKEVRGVATCLAEVAHSVMKEKTKWAVFGFNDTFQVVKDFDEQYTINTKARIGGLEQKGATYLPDAVRTAAKLLAERPVDTHYLVVVSDFLPVGYYEIEKHLNETMEDIQKTGISTIGIGVKNNSVAKYFQVKTVITDPYQMMKFFVRAYMELAGAS
ncbi:MAG: VWA domain-containing protein [Nitrososphaerota archaeon]|jgi:Mg-chelatase subunit ChlD|nr:VWA domain-containing protein [Nitrososphaerota archaeon]MDG6948842.1 VWA domain-containing protein [Nitrososphaerota archaeon]